MERLFAIAKITRATGPSGEVRLRPLSRYFNEFLEDRPLFLGFSQDLAHEIQLEKYTGNSKRPKYQFQGINSRAAAEALIGQILFVNIPENDFASLSSDELIGYEVITEAGHSVGLLSDILMMPADDVYVIDNEGREVLIPVIPEIIKGIDDEENIIIIAPMDGLLD